MVNYYDFVKKVQEGKYIEWDLKTITSGDYTVEFSLDPGFFKRWVETEFLNFAKF